MNDQWRTPGYLFRYAEYLVRGFDFDAACNKDNALAPPLASGYGDALKAPWKGKIWCNPPYSDIDPWVERALTANQGSTVVMLIPSCNGESRYMRLCEHAYEILIIGRIGFLNEEGREIKGNRQGSSLFIIGDYEPGTRIVMDREAIRNWRWSKKP